MKPESAQFVAAELRAHDRDRYFATLLIDPPLRQAVTALYAFSAQIAAIRNLVREPTAGEIRLQWWADALTGEGHGAVRQNPVAAALLDTIAEHGLPVPALTRLLQARRFDLYDDPMPDLPTFEGYAGETSSALYQLAAMILNNGPVEPGDAAGHLGVAQALIGHLRAFGFNASKGRIFLPWSVFAAHGVVEADLLDGRTSEGLEAALLQLAEIADNHLDSANLAIARLPRNLRPVFAPIAVLRAQRARLDFTAPFAPPEDLADWRKIVTLSWWRLRS